LTWPMSVVLTERFPFVSPTNTPTGMRTLPAWSRH
jgi:hypothetical protein